MPVESPKLNWAIRSKNSQRPGRILSSSTPCSRGKTATILEPSERGFACRTANFRSQSLVSEGDEVVDLHVPIVIVIFGGRSPR